MSDSVETSGYPCYALFGGREYYPAGGFDDFISVHETFEEAHAAGKALINSDSIDWGHIVDLSVRPLSRDDCHIIMKD